MSGEQAGEADDASTHSAPLARTLFVVGDVKQSIYGFQGADPAAFQAANQVLKARWDAAKLPWVDVSLDLSYRSTPPILQLVDAVFNQEEGWYSQLGAAEPLRHQAHPGRQVGGRWLWHCAPRHCPRSLRPGAAHQRLPACSAAAACRIYRRSDRDADEERWLPSVNAGFSRMMC